MMGKCTFGHDKFISHCVFLAESAAGVSLYCREVEHFLYYWHSKFRYL